MRRHLGRGPSLPGIERERNNEGGGGTAAETLVGCDLVALDEGDILELTLV